MRVTSVLNAWTRVLSGCAPILSIEITRECPLTCPGCYAYGDAHLGGGVTLRQLSDLSGDALVEGIVTLVQRHQPVQVSLVGGEPLVRHRELSRVLAQSLAVANRYPRRHGTCRWSISSLIRRPRSRSWSSRLA